MSFIVPRRAGRTLRRLETLRLAFAFAVIGFLACATGAAYAQPVGIATMQPGTLAHTVASAIAKVLKEKGGVNTLVQPMAGESVAIAIVGRGEAELGLANAPEVASAVAGGAQPKLRLIGALHPLRAAMFVRKSSPMTRVTDAKGKRVPMGFSAMRVLNGMARAILATGGLTEADVQPVFVSNVIRSADEFASGTADMFLFAFGAPKVREVDATIGGIRALEIPETPGILAANKVSPYGYLTHVKPSPFFIGVAHPMKVYSFDHLLYTHADVPEDAVYKIIETLANSKSDLVAVAPALREFSAGTLNKNYKMPYHPGALRYFRDKGIEAKPIL